MKASHLSMLGIALVVAGVLPSAGQVPTRTPGAVSIGATSSTAPSTGAAPAAEKRVEAHPFPPDWAGTAENAENVTERIHQAAVKWLAAAPAQVDRMVPAAEAVADRLIAGGSLYVVGGEGFTNEMFYRAGGFSFARVWRRHRVGPNDVVIMAHVKPNDTGVPWIEFDAFHRFLDLRNGLVVQFTSFRWPQSRRMFQPQEADFWGGRLHRFDTGGPPGGSPQQRALCQMATLALAWAFQGEVIAAASRRGKTLATYASDEEPAAREGWDRTVAGKVFHPKYKAKPVPAGKLGRQYLRICREQVSQFLTSQPAKVRAAAGRMARCAAGGGMIWAATSSHVLRSDCVFPAHLPILWVGRDYTYSQSALRPGRGDMLLWMGYLGFPDEVVKTTAGRGVECVVVSVERPPADSPAIHIASCWKAYDSAVELPGYPIRILPTSGVLHTLQWYSILGEFAEALGDGKGKPASERGRS
jgi:hypothetical protein